MSGDCEHLTTDNIRFSIQGYRIFRDQCLKCYDSPKSEGGLDICLKCFSGFCRNQLFNHSLLHYNQYSHPIVMNIKERKVEQTSEVNEPKMITKLAIGKPGGADFSDEKWEQVIEVSCRKCNKSIDYKSNEQLSALVISILNAASESDKSGIQAWEEEINPCEHTLTLQQAENIKIAEKTMAKCSKCDLSSNLWLCLTCGNLSCGRKETGGNAHAIEHFKLTNHPLVVKTGTITPNGDASIYCYSCDNDVKDPELAIHLQNFGIDVSTQKKTDKTVTEMNLDININLTLSKTIEEGKVLTPLYGEGLTGMENIGNSCYINSIVQILFSLEPMKKWYYDTAIDHLNTCSRNAQDCYLCQMSKIMYGLHSGVYSQKKTKMLPATEEGKPGDIEEYQDGIKPSSFKLFFGKDHPEFSTNHQQDVFEYLQYLLSCMEKEDKARKINPLDLFKYECENRLECQKCHGVKYRSMKNWYLLFTVEDWKNKKGEDKTCTMEDCIKTWLGEEIVSLKCSVCNEDTTWVKTQKIKNFPQYLIILFQRMIYDWIPVKLELKFEAVVDNCDLTCLQRDHSKPGEKVIEANAEIEDEIEEKEPEFDINKINYLLQCGIPELGAKWALLKNNNNEENAMIWYCEHGQSPEYTQPLPKVKVSKKGKKVLSNVDELAVAQLQSMGFPKEKCEIALRKTNNNVESALEFLFEHPEEIVDDLNDEEVEDNKEINKGNGSVYNLYGYLTHLGKQATHGHYVSHIRKEGNNYIYFNDLRVNAWENPPIHKGYIYVYKNTNVGSG